MDSSSACGFFDIILGLFIETPNDASGKIVGMCIHYPIYDFVLLIFAYEVLDEAHKVRYYSSLLGTSNLFCMQYLNDNGSASRLTDSLLSIIRQQRHLGTRIVISTQEPTVVPSKFLDLCSFVIAHRFSSPQWLNHLLHHVAAKAAETDSWFSKVCSRSVASCPAIC